MTRGSWAAMATLVILCRAAPVLGESDALVGVGPSVGLWDVGDGHHLVGLYANAMLHSGPNEGSVSWRFDVSCSRFWASKDGVGNRDYFVFAPFANMIVSMGHSGTRPYWALGTGLDFTDEPHASGLVFGTGIGVRFGWGVIEGRFDLAHTAAGVGASVPVFAAFRF